MSPRERPRAAGPRVDLLVATGGTGGHIYPALAVARAAAARGLTLTFLGQEGGMEARLVPVAGFPFEGVPAGKWDRERPDPRQALRALAGVASAWRALRVARPRLVVGFGGFASFPGCLAAVLTGTPLALHEGNALPSRVTRWFAPRARLVVLAQPEAAAWLGSARATAVLPFPVREVRVPRERARAELGLAQDAVVTLVMGGSQGSATLNRVVPNAFDALPTELRERLVVLHSSGERWLADTAARATGPAYRVVPYVDAALAFGAADLAITRAGVSTLSDAAFHGVPLLMIPLPTSAENHQLHNARAVEAAGAGRVIEEAQLGELAAAWAELLDPDRRAAGARAAAARTPAGAAERIVDALLPLLEARAPNGDPRGVHA